MNRQGRLFAREIGAGQSLTADGPERQSAGKTLWPARDWSGIAGRGVG
jgi:hypothetical protein